MYGPSLLGKVDGNPTPSKDISFFSGLTTHTEHMIFVEIHQVNIFSVNVVTLLFILSPFHAPGLLL